VKNGGKNKKRGREIEKKIVDETFNQKKKTLGAGSVPLVLISDVF
jgi:hypothetical protein